MIEPLSERKDVILNVLSKYPDGIGFNELCREMREIAARQTVKNELDELVRLNLVVKKAGRKGQKVSYLYRDFTKTAESISEDLEFLSDLLETVKSDVSRIEKEVGKPLSAITREDADHPALRKLIRQIDSFAHTALIISLIEWRYPPRLRERFKEIEEPFQELIENFSRIINLNPKLSQKYCEYVWRQK